MPTNQRCGGRTARGEPCSATPRANGLCLWHDPELEDAAREARKLGGQRRKREVAIRGAFDIEGLTSIPEIRRVVEIAVADLLGKENSVPRARTLLSAAQTAAKLLEAGEIEARLEALERAMEPRLRAGEVKRDEPERPQTPRPALSGALRRRAHLSDQRSLPRRRVARPPVVPRRPA